MKIKKSDIIYSIAISVLLFFAFLPDHDTLFGKMSSLFRMAAEALCLIIGIINLIRRKSKPDFFIVFITALHLQLVFAGIINGTEIFPFIKRALHIISICIFIKGESIKRTTILLRGTIITFIALAIINLVYRIPNHEITHVFAAGSIYYLGSDNEAVSPLLTLLSLCILFCYIKKINCLSLLGAFLSVFTIFYSKTGTGMMAVVIILGGLCAYHIPVIKRVTGKLTNANIMILAFFLYYIILWGIVNAKYTFLGDLIYKVTQKDSLTFTNRDVIWAEAVRLIKINLFRGIGYGNGADGNGVFANGIYRGAHNTILQWGVNGGILTIVFFILALYTVFRKIEKFNSPKKVYSYICIFAFLIAMSMENYSNGLHFIPLLAIIYYTIEPMKFTIQKTDPNALFNFIS